MRLRERIARKNRFSQMGLLTDPHATIGLFSLTGLLSDPHEKIAHTTLSPLLTPPTPHLISASAFAPPLPLCLPLLTPPPTLSPSLLLTLSLYLPATVSLSHSPSTHSQQRQPPQLGRRWQRCRRGQHQRERRRHRWAAASASAAAALARVVATGRIRC